MKLFHLSENANIRLFSPRPSKKIWNFRPYVWAIDEEKVHNYLLPRNCPRICLSTQNLDPLKSFFDIAKLREKKALLCVPEGWMPSIRTCQLFQYEFDPSNFKLIDAIAGYYVSEQSEQPLAVQTINDCLSSLKAIEVEVLPLSIAQLKLIRAVVVEELKEFSIIRWDYLE